MVGENAASIDAYAASDPAECLPYFLNISLAPQNFLLLVSLIVATFLPILSTRSFAETASPNDTDSFSATNVH